MTQSGKSRIVEIDCLASKDTKHEELEISVWYKLVYRPFVLKIIVFYKCAFTAKIEWNCSFY